MFSAGFAEDLSGARDMAAKVPSEFEMQRAAAISIFDCSKVKDEACRRMVKATSIYDLRQAVEAKEVSKQKHLTDRISVLECCLGVDAANACVGFDKELRADVETCKATLAATKKEKK